MNRIEITGIDLSDQVSDVDIRPKLDSLPTRTLKVSGYWDDPAAPLFPPGSTKLRSIKWHKTSFTIAVTIEPWYYRRITGKAHPRIRRMHTRYPAKWSKQSKRRSRR